MQKHQIARKLNIAKKLKLNNAFSNLGDTAKQKLETIRGGVRLGRKAVRSVDRYSRKNPWMVVGVFSFAAWALGFVTGMRRSSHSFGNE